MGAVSLSFKDCQATFLEEKDTDKKWELTQKIICLTLPNTFHIVSKDIFTFQNFPSGYFQEGFKSLMELLTSQQEVVCTFYILNLIQRDIKPLAQFFYFSILPHIAPFSFIMRHHFSFVWKLSARRLSCSLKPSCLRRVCVVSVTAGKAVTFADCPVTQFLIFFISDYFPELQSAVFVSFS